MKIVLAGGTGFIGKPLLERLLQSGHEVTLLTRKDRPSSANLKIEIWDAKNQGPWSSSVEMADAVINLSGESIAAKRWSPAQKNKIIQSRQESTRALVEAMTRVAKKPEVFINASAVGFYGPVVDKEVDEQSPKGNGFLADTCAMWESEALKAANLGVRVVLFRLGVVIEKGGGALDKFLLPFKFYAGGPLGSGKQWFPWVHREDVVDAILFCLKEPNLSGPVNAVAPDSVTMSGFCSALGRAMHRPSWAPVPGFALQLMLGEMSQMILTGQKVIPRSLSNAGYVFKHPDLGEALNSVLKS